MKKNILLLFSLFFISSLSSPVQAFQDDVERYPTGDYTDYYTHTFIVVKNAGLNTTSDHSVTLAPDPSGLPTTTMCLYAKYGVKYANGNGYVLSGVCSDAVFDPSYISFIASNAYYSRTGGSGTGSAIRIALYTNADQIICEYEDPLSSTPVNYQKYELVKSGGSYSIYRNGILLSNVANNVPDYTGDVKLSISAKAFHSYEGTGTYYSEAFVYIDDITDRSIIGLPKTVTESQQDITFTWSAQLKRSYPSTYYIKLYSLTNQNNAGEITSIELSNQEHGNISIPLSIIGEENSGLYMLEMQRGSIIITDSYFVYSPLSNPQTFPELLFLGESNVHINIRDEDNNGGETLGGGSVYLYPEINENGIYSFTYDILETPASIQLSISKIYNNTALNQTDITISGLSGQNYEVKLNGVSQGKNEGAGTFQLSITDWASPSKTITLEPDLTAPGFWGYVKNEETQNPIKSATVTISNGTYSKYLYTDTNGMYYITAEIYPGAYNISASKNGFSTSLTFQETAAEGATTRKDIFLALSSGSGVYYAPHDVRFTIKEFWYSNTLPGVSYSVYDSVTEETDKTGYTDSQGSFTVSNMDSYKNYTITLNHQGTNYTKYIEPGLDEYTLILKEGSTIHSYGASWLNLTYSETAGDIMVYYNSSEIITEASLTVTAMNGSTIFTGTNTANTGSFNVDLSAAGEYLILFEIETITGKTASQSWAYSSSQNVDLFPESYPAWLKNTLFGGIVVLFLLSFGKSKNDIACLSVAILTSLGYHFSWHTGSFGFVVLVWIIAAGAAALHYKRTGHLG